MPDTPLDSTLKAVIHDSFSRQTLMQTLGARLIRVETGVVEVEIASREGLSQQNGLLHAGAIASIADTACGYAALTMMPPGSDVVSVEFKLNLLEAARGKRFVARAHVIRAGKTLTVCHADVVALGSSSDVVVAVMQATMMRR